MVDKRAMQDELTEKFINYQYRLDNPMPSTKETPESIRHCYFSNIIFRAKVDSIVAAIMVTLDEHLEDLK